MTTFCWRRGITQWILVLSVVYYSDGQSTRCYQRESFFVYNSATFEQFIDQTALLLFIVVDAADTNSTTFNCW